MDTTQIQLYARQLFEERGSQAIVAAAGKARQYERAGDSEQAQTWRRIEAALMLMSGPRQT